MPAAVILDPIARFRWAARKLRLGIPRSGLVLDLGSGGGPHPRADVLVERGDDSRHRVGEAVVRDRPLVYADGAHLPFRDKAFRFVVLSHVLEHIPDPGPFLDELQRVGEGGYIETPNVMFERLHPYDLHVLEVRLDGEVLRLRKKPSATPDPFLAGLGMLVDKPGNQMRHFFLTHPELFHVRYWWRGNIDYVVENPDVNTEWFSGAGHSSTGEVRARSGRRGWRGAGRFAARLYHEQMSRRQLKDRSVSTIR